jgi:hypothetical protein
MFLFLYLKRYNILITVMTGLITLFAALPCTAQLYIGSDANSLFIKSGETFNYEGLTLSPSSNFTLSNTTLTRTDARTITPAPSGNYAARYFSFSNTTSAFSGTVRISYSGATLLPLLAGSLELNIRTNGTNWTRVSGSDSSAGSFVSATLSSPATLNILALASNVAPLPVSWLQFTAVKKEKTALLTWVTATEQNTQDYLVQYSSTDNWQTLGMVKAAGYSSAPLRYTYVHQSPRPGYNHYRLVQRDLDGTQSFSGIATMIIGDNGSTVSVYPNPLKDQHLTVTVAEPLQVYLFDATGRKVLSQYLREGMHALNLSGLCGGIYQLRAGTEVLPIIIP